MSQRSPQILIWVTFNVRQFVYVKFIDKAIYYDIMTENISNTTDNG